MPYEMTSSMHYDVMNNKPLELEWLNGAVVRLGKEAGVPTPVNSFIYAALKLLKDGAT
jgi:2-dehydropantoate 2-reductase